MVIVKKIIINNEPWQTRIAITQDNELQNIYFETHTTESLERSFFKGVVSKVLPGIQTAFVDIGQERAGFLHISEIDRDLAIRKISKYTQIDELDDDQKGEESEKKAPALRKSDVDISKILKEGDHILVQVSKEPVYEKGAKLSTCYILPGRFVVLMPNIPRIGISKKIENKEERVRLKDLVRKHLPEGMGAIIRTTSDGREEADIIKDLAYLVQTWQTIQQGYAQAQPEACIYRDIPLYLQIIRDHLDSNVEAIVVDDKAMQSTLYQFIKNVAPEYSHIVRFYQGPPDIFSFYDIEQQIQEALARKVPLKSGGTLIIETTEAMTVIDVNTGRFIGKVSLEETILKTNIEAAEEIARQLRLRNIGGLIVIDFIDMSLSANRKRLFHYFEKMLKERDKFQSVVLKISEFGIVQMTRKRSGKTLSQQLLETCPSCAGLGMTRSLRTECCTLLRTIKTQLQTVPLDTDITIVVNPVMFEYLTQNEYNAILAMEKILKHKIVLMSNNDILLNQYKINKS